ncbi:MAG: PemK family transcriptional regulator [Desulfobulbaceae bacterium DB1]|nr:MAG: PemK family transcriptional regulator [Desulfobulbaceae bacterium DB1]
MIFQDKYGTLLTDAIKVVTVALFKDLFNSSNINTVVVCTLTSNLKRGQAPGNITLNMGEANLPKKNVVNISQIYTVNKSELTELIGKVSEKRMGEILEGLKLLTEPKSL